jgi:hypothetical protein
MRGAKPKMSEETDRHKTCFNEIYINSLKMAKIESIQPEPNYNNTSLMYYQTQMTRILTHFKKSDRLVCFVLLDAFFPVFSTVISIYKL